MATYFHGAPEIQQDGLQTLYLMNPGFVGYSDAPAPPANMVFLNPMSNSHNFLGCPLQSSDEISAIQSLHYNLSTPTPSDNQLGLRQGLSLSLSPQDTQYGLYRPQPEIPASTAEITPACPEEVRIPGTSSGMQSFLMGSNYLKAAQQLLDEVVYVRNAKQRSKTPDSMNQLNDTDAKRGAEITTAERQELQMKKAKLVSMLDEVEQRYKQYHHQMQIVVSSFQSAAGIGAARTYTALALQTISKQFRCLRDSISGQIRATSKSLGDENCLGAAKSQDSRLRFVDQHLRQQRALQQLGMFQHNAWRPQRGLPERSVSVLRAWLFEHFLHPYPTDSDKLMLAKQTGLTRGQVSNWFINARVRLWKPMVEEMYLEETKEQAQEQEQSNRGERSSKSDANEEDSMSKSPSARQESSPTKTEQTDPQLPPITVHNSSYNNGESQMQQKIKKARSDQSLHTCTMRDSMDGKLESNETSNREIMMSFGDGRNHGYSLIESSANHGGGFGDYSIGGIGRFDHQQFAPRFMGNSVSLTLGLPHCESLSLSGAQPPYLSSESIPMGTRAEMSSERDGYCNSLNRIQPVDHRSNGYEEINIQSRKRFAAQLLPDFVA